MRLREPELRQFVQSIMAGGFDWTTASDRALDFLEDVDATIRLAARWPMRGILGLEPGQYIDRWTIAARSSEKAHCDPEFRLDWLRHPLCMSALAAWAGLEIRPASYLWQVRKATVVEELPGLHWLVLPACHLGCAPDPRHASPSAAACLACGKSGQPMMACSRLGLRDASPKIRDVDEQVIRLVQADESARRRLLADPTGFFREVAGFSFQVHPESLGIREVRVAEDTKSSVVLVLLRPSSSQPALTSPKSLAE